MAERPEPLRPQISHFARPVSRRDFVAGAGAGFGSVALASLLADSTSQAMTAGVEAIQPGGRRTHFPARAKSVIWCFLDGGPSHIDLFDPKPELEKLAGQPL